MAFMMISYIGQIAFSHYMILSITEIVLMKAIYIFKFSRIASMNEYFITTTLILSNIVIILIIMVLRVTVKEYESSAMFGYYNKHNQGTDLHENVLK